MFTQFAPLFEFSRITHHPGDTVLTSLNVVYQRSGNEFKGFFSIGLATPFSIHLVSYFEKHASQLISTKR